MLKHIWWSLLAIDQLVTIASGLTTEDYGDIFHCIVDPDYTISDLTTTDKQNIDELSFVMVLYRHGNRYPNDGFSFNDLFPDTKTNINCNIKRVKSTIINNESSKYGLKLIYPFGDQLTQNSNCEETQISDNNIQQMLSTGEIIAERYFGKNKDQFNKKKDCSPDIIYSDTRVINRVLDSQLYFIEGLLDTCNDDDSSSSSSSSSSASSSDDSNDNNCDNRNNFIEIETEVTDLPNDPFAQFSSGSFCRENIEEFQEWYLKYTNTALNGPARGRYLNTNPNAIDARNSYLSEGGKLLIPGIFNNQFINTWIQLGFYYCADIDIPLTFNTFDKVMKTQFTVLNTYDESITGKEANLCYNHQISRSAYNKVYNRLMNVLSGIDNKKMYIVGTQGLSVSSFLWGLDLFDDRQFIKQGEAVTFEVYKKYNGNDNDDDDDDDGIVDTSNYVFRFTRNGKFLPYKPCLNDYDLNNSELCDLDILLNDEYGFNDAINGTEWRNLCENVIDECLCGFCD